MPKFVDKCVPNRTEYKVYEEYATILNQTNIGANNNKFYIIQLLLKNEKDYYIWTRWGRVGENGQNNMDAFGDSEKNAIAEFKKKFKAKTGNKWESVEDKSFEAKDGKYCLIEVDEKEDNVGSTENSEINQFGKLSTEQIEKGQKVLKKIENLILEKEQEKKQESKSDLDLDLYQKLSSEFFTLIPTVTGRKKPEPITTIDVVKQKEELLKFYLRMGFEEVHREEDKGLTPISGVMDLPLLATLAEAIGKCCSSSDVKSSVKQGKELAKKKAGNPVKEMDQELYGSIMLYTSNAIYKELNKVLREENRTAVKKYFNYLRMFLEAMDRLPKQQKTLWRGISVDLYDKYKVGQNVIWWGVSSCTSDKKVAENFMNGCGGNCTFLTIETKTATDISEISFYSNEKESLLAPGTEFKVLSSEKKGKVTYIHLEEIGRVIK
jgi:predicted DNA-binding WGR domain protein